MDILSRTARRLKVRLITWAAWSALWCCVGAELGLRIGRRLAHPVFAWWALLLGIALLVALASSSHAQDALVGYEDGSLDIFTPVEVVDAGGAPRLSDHTPQGAGTAAAGHGTAASRDDHVHPSTGGGTSIPLSNVTPKVESGAGAAGIASAASRGDHVHPARTIPKQPLSSFGTVGSPGNCAKANATRDGLAYGTCGAARTLSNQDPLVADTALPGTRSDVSRSDHVHPARTIPKQPLSSFGTVGASGTCAKANSSRDGLTYGSCGSPRVLSNRDPAAPGTADPGNRTDVSRSDHVHPGGGSATPLSNAAAKNLGVAAAGTSTDASRADHVHSQTSFLGIGIPGPDTVAGAVGVSTLSARADHVHRSQIPGLTGHGGNCLKANAGATGLEFSACGGSSGGGSAGLTLTEIASFSAPLSGESVPQEAADKITAAIQGELSLFLWHEIVEGKRGIGPSAVTIYQYFTHLFTNASVPEEFGTDSHDFYFDDPSSTAIEIGDGGHFSVNPFFPTTAFHEITVYRVSFGSGGSGGGASGVSLPRPTPAGASKYLRVNAAGAAYELGGPLDDDITEIEAGVGALQRVTQDLSVASVATPWATSTVQGAGIATGTCSTSAAPSSGYAATKARPQTGWPANTCVFAQLPKDADVTTYRVVEPQGDSATFFDPGGSWRLKLARPASATRDYWLVNTVSPGDESLTLQHGGTVQRTTYRGRVAAWGGDLPAIPGDTATKQYALETKTDGSGVEWSNDIFSALNTNAQDIGDALERVGHIDMPSDAEASKSALAAGQVWTIGSCKDTAGSRECTAGFAESAHGTQRHLVTHGTGAANATSASFAPVGRLTQHALISGTSYDEFVVIARHVAGNPTRTMIRSCRIPGIQGDWLANAANPVHLISESGNCSLVAPATGNLTVTWAAPLAGQKIAGDTWRLYGVDWR